MAFHVEEECSVFVVTGEIKTEKNKVKYIKMQTKECLWEKELSIVVVLMGERKKKHLRKKNGGKRKLSMVKSRSFG